MIPAVDTQAALLGAVPMPLVLVAADGSVETMNARAIDLLGTQGVGRSHIAVMRQPALLDCIEAAQRGGRPGSARYVDTSMTREAVYTVIAAPVQLSGGLGVLVSFDDITDLERAERMRRDFVANVSHEMKTPLTAVLGFIETLRGAAREDATVRDRFLGIMQREAERMNRLVVDLLSLSRVESVERQRPRERVVVEDLIASTLAALRNMAEAEGVTLEVEGEDTAGLTLPGDHDQLQQVLTNLVENAVKYASAGERVTLRVTRHARERAFRGPAVQIDVIDYGEGFDPIHIPRLTERFYRVDTHRSREMGGTGLGLSIAKHIINRHRGRLRIDSEPGSGSTFTVLLPVT
ncbi:MAG: ATP-binding protein [Pseudomonadota bacterium]